MTETKHLIIIGGGPGGYVAAIRATQLGAQVTVVEQDALGGVCLNWGCIPSKTLLSIIELGHKVQQGHEFGLVVSGPVSYDLEAMRAQKDKVVGTLVKGIETLFKTWGIKQIQGRGVLESARAVNVTKSNGETLQLEGDAIVLATGSSWPNLPLFPIDGISFITSKDALDPKTVPERLAIVGGGVEGCEFASLYNGLGSKVSVIELMPKILPGEDEEISSTMSRELKKRGVVIWTGTSVEQVNRQDPGLALTLKNGQQIEVDQVLVSVGRGFHSENIGLEKVGVQVGPKKEILVNNKMETNIPGIYAIGDVTGKAMLAHVASAQGKVAVENIMGHPKEMNYHVVPAGIFTSPEIGRVGLTEQQARESMVAKGQDPGQDLRIGRFRYAALGKAHATGDTVGLFKILSDHRTGKILGVHIIGAHAADLIHEAALAMEVGATVAQVAEMIHAHPTLAEGFMEAAEDVMGMAIHIAKQRK